jgi:hypothetical protein
MLAATVAAVITAAVAALTPEHACVQNLASACQILPRWIDNRFAWVA